MSFDITHILEQWSYKPGQVVVRKFKGLDGVEKIQLRVDLGLLQMNAAGRPDGKKPYGHESLLEHFRSRLEKHQARHAGEATGFTLKPEDCSKLHQEAIQYHHRYICLFQLDDYLGVQRDTDRNLAVFDFVSEHAPSEEFAWTLQQLRPQLLMMRTRARGALALQANRHRQAVELIETGIEEIKEFYRRHARQELIETSAEIQSLEAWAGEIQLKRPRAHREKLEMALQDAVQREDYETAARYRDKLRKLKPFDPL